MLYYTTMELTFIVFILRAITSLNEQKVNMSSMGSEDDEYSIENQKIKLIKLQKNAAAKRRFTSGTKRELEACEKWKKQLDNQLIKAIDAATKAQEVVEHQKKIIRVLSERDSLRKEKEEWNKSKGSGVDDYPNELYLEALAGVEGKIAAKATEEGSADKVPAVVSPTKKGAEGDVEVEQGKAGSAKGDGTADD